MISPGFADCTENFRIDANRKLEPEKRSALGQFMTPISIARFMASLFKEFHGEEIFLLDPGAGVGSLTAAFLEEFAQKKDKNLKIHLTAYEIDPILLEYLQSTIRTGSEVCKKSGVSLDADIKTLDFIEDIVFGLANDIFSDPVEDKVFSHVIINPPYKKISSNSLHRKLLKSINIETSNLYTGFLALAIKLLKPGGELVAIVPRSFCNGPYFKSFRELLLKETALNHLHVFESRNRAFKDDDVLQENIIFHCIKGEKPKKVTITSSNGANFLFDEKSREIISEEMTRRTVFFSSVVKPNDPEKFIHLATTGYEQAIIDKISFFNSSLEDLNIEISTGPVVDFRFKAELVQKFEPGTAPLLYPTHFKNNYLEWPKDSKKPNAIRISKESQKWLWSNSGNFVVTRRFTSKEEKRRVVAAVYNSSLPGKLIGFENHLNVFHKAKEGLSKEIAQGLAIYLNSTLVDQYFRQFSGHTQVNATDLRSLNFPNIDIIKSLGRQTYGVLPSQKEIDKLLDKEITNMVDSPSIDPIKVKEKIEEALLIIKALGLPKGQHNDRSALTLLAILNQTPEKKWSEVERILIGITPIMEFCSKHYGREYAPNSRETFRRQTMHQFVDAGIAIYNPDEPGRAVNSPKACYQVSLEAFEVIETFGTSAWSSSLEKFLENQKTLAQRYAKEREMQMIPVDIKKEQEIYLSPGNHSLLIKEIINGFAPRFAPGSDVIYIGDTGEKEGYFQKDLLSKMNVEIDKHGKMPDVVLYFSDKDWLLLIEAVTSHGPVNAKRHEELSTLFKNAKPGLVFVTAFPDRSTLAKYLSDISWETEVWVAESPTHMIHFNGEKFLGPW